MMSVKLMPFSDRIEGLSALCVLFFRIMGIAPIPACWTCRVPEMGV